MRPRFGTWVIGMMTAGLLLPVSVWGQAQPPRLAITGVVYSEYEYLFSDSADHRNSFNVTRAYLNFLGNFDHGISTRVTADIYRDARNSLGYRLKYAYFAWHPEGSVFTPKSG